MITADILTITRTWLADEDNTAYRWANSLLCDTCLNLFCRWLWDRRPDVHFDDDGDAVTLVENYACTAETLPAATLWIPNEFKLAAAHHIAAQAFEMDGNDRKNVEAAAEHQAQAEALI